MKKTNKKATTVNKNTKAKEAPLPKGHKNVMPPSFYNRPKGAKSGGVY